LVRNNRKLQILAFWRDVDCTCNLPTFALFNQFQLIIESFKCGFSRPNVLLHVKLVKGNTEA